MPKKQDKAAQALAFAEGERKRSDSWITFHNALYGIGGKLGELFPTQGERAAFVKTPEHARIAEMLGELQEEDSAAPSGSANGAVSVRMPRSVHAALLAEAEAEHVSLNQLCVSKLSTQLRAAVH